MQDIKEKLDAALRVRDEVGEKITLVLEDGELCEIYYDLREVPQEWHFPLWEIYNEVMDIDTIQDQRCYSQQTFMEALLDPDYLKVVLILGRSPAGLGLGTNNLEKARIAYINPDFLKRRYPEYARKDKIFYLTCGCFGSEAQHRGVLPYFMLAAAQSIYVYYDVAVADVSPSTSFMKDAMKYYLNLIGAPIVKEEILGQQTYFSYIIREPS